MKCPSDLTLTPDGVSPEAQASLLLGAKIGCRRQTLTLGHYKNAKLKKLVAEQLLAIETLKEFSRGK